MMDRPTFLVTNDDGIQVFFLRALVEALSLEGEVYVAAPKREQSWVGKGVSRHTELSVESYPGFDRATAWAIDGTPSDAVNIALGHLLPRKPDVVVSGINVGWNAMLPVLYSSGTVAGALEGASWGIPAIALSIHLHAQDFDLVKEDSVNPPSSIQNPVRTAAKLGAQFAATQVGRPNEHCQVHNINFPALVREDSPWVTTRPGRVRLGSLFEKTGEGHFRFRYSEPEPLSQKDELPSDYETFSNGSISRSLLDFHNLKSRPESI